MVEANREEEFAPLKNATGPDSPATVYRLMTRLHAAWLEAAGAKVPRTPDGEVLHAVEVSPLFALDAAECAAKLPKGYVVSGPVCMTPL